MQQQEKQDPKSLGREKKDHKRSNLEAGRPKKSNNNKRDEKMSTCGEDEVDGACHGHW